MKSPFCVARTLQTRMARLSEMQDASPERSQSGKTRNRAEKEFDLWMSRMTFDLVGQYYAQNRGALTLRVRELTPRVRALTLRVRLR